MRPLIDETAWPRMASEARREDFSIDAADVKKIVDRRPSAIARVGYDLIKHDFSTVDIVGRWGKDMKDGVVSADDGLSHRATARRGGDSRSLSNHS